jgi:hypothetical protein
MKKLILSMSLLSLLTLFIAPSKAQAVKNALPTTCLNQVEKGAKSLKISAFYSKAAESFYIVSYIGSDEESGGQVLFVQNDAGGCLKLATDNSVFPLSRWTVSRMGSLPADVINGLALDDAKRSLKVNPVKQVSSEYLAPEQAAAYRSLGVKVQ